ncbi:MAG: hypothetical protein U0587_06350 [Candidatus Binatia bacterium]
MWQRKLSGLGVATLLLAATAVSQAGAAGIVNGGFETGSFTPPSDPVCVTNGAVGYYDGFAGWTVVGHDAMPPVSPFPTTYPDCALPVPAAGTPYYGAQVLTKDDLLAGGISFGTVVPPEGTHFALVSSIPSGTKDPNNPNEPNDEPAECPTSTNQPTAPNTDQDSDGHWERDRTIISQQFSVDQVPASISFTWSYLAGEKRDSNQNWLHDNFQVLLTPISPSGSPIQILGVTAGNVYNPAYGGTGFYQGTFVFIDPTQLDGVDYQVLTLPAGGPTDCHHSGFGRTAFRNTTYPIPSAGTWEIKFIVADDGGDGIKTTGVLLDDVRLNYGSRLAPAISPAGLVLVALILAAVGIFSLAARGVRPRPTTLVAGALLLFGTVLLLSHSQAASGSLRPAGGSENAVVAAPNAGDDVAQVRRPAAPTLVPTRPPYATQTPIVS